MFFPGVLSCLTFPPSHPPGSSFCHGVRCRYTVIRMLYKVCMSQALLTRMKKSCRKARQPEFNPPTHLKMERED
ncbi:hypothetical protein LEMLEM_LOCUS5366 [Lemmus lemmus]